MKHITLRLAVTVITFFIGIVAAALWFSQSSAPKKCASDSYFPVGVLSQSPGKVDQLGKYYSAMMESPFLCLDEDIEAYRLLLLASFEPPASIRVWREGGQKYVEVKQLSSIGIPQYGAKDLKVNVTRPLTDHNGIIFRSYWRSPTSGLCLRKM